MGTPFIQFQGPASLVGYDRSKPASEQPAHIPQAFLDAMTVREDVFVRMQGVPLENEHDEDDARSCHWVVYASVNKVVQHEVRGQPPTGDVLVPRRSETTTQPVGTLRLVPFPHTPHPKPGGKYVDGKLMNAGEAVPPGGIIAHENGGGGARASGQASDNEEAPVVEPLTEEERRRMVDAQPFGVDRPTSMHDGREPYVKLGRLAVVPGFRGHKLSGLLVGTALMWLRENPSYFNPSVKEVGMEVLGINQSGDVPEWNGLVCCHAQEEVIPVWKKYGFEVDELMGRWWEENIPHVGMFLRLKLDISSHA